MSVVARRKAGLLVAHRVADNLVAVADMVVVPVTALLSSRLLRDRIFDYILLMRNQPPVHIDLRFGD